MFSSKTTSLLSYIDRFTYQKLNIKAYKPSMDNRYSFTDISTHSGLKYPAKVIVTGDDILIDVLSFPSKPDVVAIDELFMIPSSAKACIELYSMGITVVTSSLDLSSHYKPFDEVTQLMPYATIKLKCQAICSICYELASYTYAKEFKDKEIVVGGSDMYEARCFDHYPLAQHSVYKA